jgi:Ca2+-binding EF-hand superfamily protein
MPGEMPVSRRSRGPDAARALGDGVKWDMVRVALDEQYALGGQLSPQSFPLLPGLFAELDADGSGRITRQEYEQLGKIAPHIRLAVEFDPPPAAGDPKPAAATESAQPTAARPPRLTLLGLCPELEAIRRRTVELPGRLLVQLGDLSLLFYTNDLVGGGDYEARAKQLLESLDADKNGYLESKEVPEEAQAQLARFEAVDTDEDGKVYAGEIVAFLSQQQAALRAQVHARAGDRDDPLFAALDVSGDDRLDGREIEAALDRLRALDANGDGKVSVDEIPAAMYVAFAQGSLENPDALFAPPALAGRGPADGSPRWFTSMDTSRDGLVSRREFLGTPRQFSQLDANGDGFVDPTEANQAEAAPAASQ